MMKGFIHQKDTVILNLYAPNKTALKQIWQTSTTTVKILQVHHHSGRFQLIYFDYLKVKQTENKIGKTNHAVYLIWWTYVEYSTQELENTYESQVHVEHLQKWTRCLHHKELTWCSIKHNSWPGIQSPPPFQLYPPPNPNVYPLLPANLDTNSMLSQPK